MFENIMDNLKEVIAIADSCPEKYQVQCFKILLNSLLAGNKITDNTLNYDDLSTTLGKFAQDFFSRHNISEEEWQRVINYDGETYSVIVSSLKEKSTSRGQIKLALLQGVKGLLESNTPMVNKAELVELCKQHAVYDSANFSAHMKRQKNLFISKGKDWQLTKPGEIKAAEVIKELSQ